MRLQNQLLSFLYHIYGFMNIMICQPFVKLTKKRRVIECWEKCSHNSTRVSLASSTSVSVSVSGVCAGMSAMALIDTKDRKKTTGQIDIWKDSLLVLRLSRALDALDYLFKTFSPASWPQSSLEKTATANTNMITARGAATAVRRD